MGTKPPPIHERAKSMNMDPAYPTRERAPVSKRTLADMTPTDAERLISKAVFNGTVKAHVFLALICVLLALFLAVAA